MTASTHNPHCVLAWLLCLQVDGMVWPGVFGFEAKVVPADKKTQYFYTDGTHPSGGSVYCMLCRPSLLVRCPAWQAEGSSAVLGERRRR